MLIPGYKTGPRDMGCHISSGKGPDLEVEQLSRCAVVELTSMQSSGSETRILDQGCIS